MGRIQNGYEAKMRALLTRVRPRRLDRGIDLLLDKARTLQSRTGVSEPHALEQVYNRLRQQLNRWNQFKQLEFLTGTLRPAVLATTTVLCDARLGGLARW